MHIHKLFFLKIKNKKIVSSIVILLFITSLFFPAFYTEHRYPYESPVTEGVYYGWFVFLWGWAGIFTWTIGWYANIGLIIAINLYMSNRPECFVCTYISFLIALSSATYRTGFHDGGASTEYISHFGTGFYVWLASFLVLLLAQENKFYQHE